MRLFVEILVDIKISIHINLFHRCIMFYFDTYLLNTYKEVFINDKKTIKTTFNVFFFLVFILFYIFADKNG